MISLSDARNHLRMNDAQEDGYIMEKLIVATAMVTAYVGHLRGDHADTTPTADIILADARRHRHEEAIDAAILLALGDLWANREASTGNPLSPAVKNLLNLFREPGYA